MNNNTALLSTLTESEMYREYERAFSAATGLPLALRPRDAWQAPFRGKAKENSFCAMMAKKSASCAACLCMQERMGEAAENQAAVLKCHFGMMEAAVPVKLGSETIGYLSTGQVFTQMPTGRQVEKVVKAVRKLVPGVAPKAVREAYRNTRVMPRMQFLAITRLLQIFAGHLAIKSNQVVLARANAEPVAVVRAKAFIRENLQEDNRSLWDRESLICHLDLEYVNFDNPAYPFLNEERIFALQEPVVDTAEKLLASYGIHPLKLMTGRGYHLVWRIGRGSKAFDDLAAFGHVSPSLKRLYATELAPTGEHVTPGLGAAFAGLGMVMEFVAHGVKSRAAPRCEVPVELGAIETGGGPQGREMISVDITEYVSRLRIERARERLANPNVRISEIACEVGFQSLTHFNRVFRKIVGEAPTTFREKLSLPLAA